MSRSLRLLLIQSQDEVVDEVLMVVNEDYDRDAVLRVVAEETEVTNPIIAADVALEEWAPEFTPERPYIG